MQYKLNISFGAPSKKKKKKTIGSKSREQI